MASSSSSRSMFPEGFVERRDLEQYFWTEETVMRLMKALEYTPDCCCLATPSLAQGMHVTGREETLLDIDTRFEYLPKFRYWDIQCPSPVGETFRVVVFDPPFFYIAMDQLFKAVTEVCNGHTSTKLLIGFLKREEPLLLKTFAPFKLRQTNFPLEYATVKPNKWRNYALYANVDLPGIRREKWSH